MIRLLLMLFIVYPTIIYSQVCQQPKYFCSNINIENDYVTYDSHAIIDAVINDNTCAIGGSNVNWSCTSGGIQNETWLMIKINHTNVPNLQIKIGSYTNININAAAWGPFNTTYFDACASMNEPSSDCNGTSQQIFLDLKNAYDGAIYFVGIRNESNQADKYIINTWDNYSSTTIKHFVPQTQNCALPTAEFISGNQILREEERVHFMPRIQFTGTPPFYFSIEEGIYDFTSPSNIFDWPTFMYPSESFEIDLNTVRNSCGVGTVIKNKIEYLVYSKDKRLVSCIPFNNSLDDEQSGQSFESSKFSYINDRNNNVYNAIGLNGIDEYLEYPARDLLGENFVIKLWVKPEIISNERQTVLSLGTEDNKSQKLEFVNGEFLFTTKLRGNRSYNIKIPATLNVWQEISMIKDSTTLSINSNLFGKTSISQNDFEVPDYGLHSKLLIGKDIFGTKYFKGGIDQFKYFSGQFSITQLNQILNSESCSLIVCDTIPVLNLPGFKRENPGVTNSYSYALIQSFFTDKLVYQIGNRIPKITYAWSQNINPNVPLRGSNYEQYTFKLKNDNNYEKFTHISGSCGTGKFFDTMHFFAAPFPIRCYNLNNNFNDYYENTTNSNIAQYIQNGSNSSASLNSNTFLNTEIIGSDTRNYSISFKFKVSNSMAINQIYDFFSFQESALFEDRLYFEKLSENYSRITFQKQQNGNNFNFQIPTLNSEWHHLVLVFKSGNNFNTGTIQLYLDNVMIINSISNFNFTSSTPNLKLFIGKKNGTSRNSIIGYIDDIKLFSGAISTSDVNILYNSNSECLTRLCENSPTYNLLDKNELTFNYGEAIKINARIDNLGPFKLKFNANGREFFNETLIKPNFYLPYSVSHGGMYNMGNNYFKIMNIENHCSKLNNPDSISFYIKPKLLECLPFNGSIINTTYKKSTYTNLLLTNDRLETPSTAIRFENNANLSFEDDTLKPLSVFFSVWIKPENKDSLVLFRMGNSQNYYSAILIKSGSAFKILAKRNGVNFLSRTIKSTFSSSTISSDVWTNIAVQFVSNGFDIYINGKLDSSIKIGQGQFPDFFNFPLIYSIGSKFDNFNSYRGVMDEVKFIHGELNSYEIKAIYNSKDCDFQYCPPQRILPTVINKPSYYQSSKSLDINSKVNDKTILHAGNSILLNNGFEVKNTTFSAEILNCPN